MRLLEVKNLKKSFGKSRQKLMAVDGISFHINEGECLGLVGESGCGKSTTANIIARLVKEDEGEIIFDHHELTSDKWLKPAGKSLQMIFQNPQGSFDPRDTVLDGIMQGALSYGIYSNEELKKRALEIFEYVGLKESYAGVKTSELSGGECQRAAIARAVIGEPKLLICDEATSALDVLVQAQIIDLLKRLKKEKDMSMLFITHNLPLAAALCDRIAVMDQGKIIEEDETQRILKSPEHWQTQNLIASVLPVSVNMKNALKEQD